MVNNGAKADKANQGASMDRKVDSMYVEDSADSLDAVPKVDPVACTVIKEVSADLED